MAQQKGIIDYGKQLVREIADTIFTKSQENLITSGAIDTSNLFLYGSIKEEQGDILINYDEPYATAINDGTDAHFVNSKELEGWVRRKINPGSEKKVKEIAFLVARAIGKRGTIPNPFFDKAVELAKFKFKF